MKFKTAMLGVWIIILSVGGSFAADDICYVCHNSKLLAENQPCAAWTDHGHPINIKPSQKVVIPPGFPLNDQGQITCSTCHIVYGAISKKDSPEKNPRTYSRKIYLRHKNVDSALCKQCHIREKSAQLSPDSEKAQYEFVVDESFDAKEDIRHEGVKIKFNHPVDIAAMRIPRQLSESSGGNQSVKDLIICQTCHRMHQAKGDALLSINNERGLLCGYCHGAMYAMDRVTSSRKGTHPVNIKPSTAVLSQDIIFRGGKKNSYGEIICLTCHGVHAAATQKSLLLKDNARSSLCGECHRREKRSIKNTKHDLDENFSDEQNIRHQTISQSGVCGTCHLAHRGTGSKMWARPIEKKEEAISDLCKSCHAPGKMADSYLPGTHSHPVGVRLDKLKDSSPRYSWLPLYSKDGIIEGKGVVTCATCHNPHRWDMDYETVSEDAGSDEGDETTSFLRMKDTNSKLCIFCHKKQKIVEKTVHDPRIDLYSKGGKIPGLFDMSGTPADSPQSRICSNCHTPHQAQAARLWSRELGPGEDTVSRICSSCHRDGFIAGEKHTGKISHPNNVPFEKPYPIDLPLYNKKLAKVEKGRVLCITCHNIHQWDPAANKPGDGVRVEGGPQNSFLRIAANSRDKSLCDDCHIDQQWVKNTEHDMVITDPKKIDVDGRTPLQAGVCASCHAVHNAPEKVKLWKPKLGPGKDKISARCNSCHYAGGSAETKIIGINSHPVGVSTFSILDNVQATSLPIFDDNFKRIYQSGEKLAPIFFLKDPESKAKIESIKMYFRVLRRRYQDLRKSMPALRRKTDRMMKKIEERKDWVSRKKAGRSDIQQKIDDSLERYKKLEFNLTLLRTKKRLLERITAGSRTGYGNTAKSIIKLKKKIEKMEATHKKTEKYFNDLYREMRDIRKKYWDELDWIDMATTKTDRMKKRYIQQVDNYKATKKELENLIAKIEGKKRSKNIDLSKIDKFDQLFKDKSIVENLTKQDLVRKLFDFRQKYFDMLKKMEELKKKTEKILKTSSQGVKSTVLSEQVGVDLFGPKPKTQEQIAHENLDLDYHIAKSFDDSDVATLEELGQGFQGKMYCITCHNPHRWNPKKNDYGPGKLVEGGNADSFLRMSNDSGSSLCKECHKGMKVIEGTEHDLRVSAPSETNYLGQNTEASGVCGSCHLVHNTASTKLLWSKTIADDKDKDKISLLCGSCHNKKGCAPNKVIGENTHVINVELQKLEGFESKLDTKKKLRAMDGKGKSRGKKTKKRKKKRKKTSRLLKKETDELEIKKISLYPLFTFEGDRDDKNGKIFCSTCHNVHQWKPGHKEIGPQTSEEGSAANSFLRDDNFNRPTLCINCHPEKESMIGTKHDLAISAPDAKNIIGQTAQDSGTCGTCHLVHNAASKHNLWARLFGPNIQKSWDRQLATEDDKTVQICASCHSAKGIANKSIPEAGLHFNRMHIIQKEVESFKKNPTYPYFKYTFDVIRKRLGILEIYQTGANPKFPLYNPQGKAVNTGNIVCPTCHDIHKWSADEDKDKSISDFSSSFLRADVASGLCSDCHGYDAIYLFAYYHKKRTEKTTGRIKDGNPHWRSSKVSGACRNCHKDMNVKYEKHPVKVPLVARRRKIRVPELADDFPLTDGKLGCPTCHNEKIQSKRILRAANPNFLQGEFYTTYWKNNFFKRTVAMVKKSKNKGGIGFGGMGMRGGQRPGPMQDQSPPTGMGGASTSSGRGRPPMKKKGQQQIQSGPRKRKVAPGPRKSRQKKTLPQKSKTKPPTTPTSHLDRSNLLRDGGLYFYSWRGLILSPWRNLYRSGWGTLEKVGSLIGNVVHGVKQVRDLLSTKSYRAWRYKWKDVFSVSSGNLGEVSNFDEYIPPDKSSDQGRLYAQAKQNPGSYSSKSYQSPYFQEKGQQGKPKVGKVKRRKKKAETKKEGQAQEDLDDGLKKFFSAPGMRKGGAKSVVPEKKWKGKVNKYQVGPRKGMVPRVSEEMLRARRKKWAKKRKKKKKKKKKVAVDKFVDLRASTATSLLVWTADESTLFDPNRYSICYECHIMEQYKQFSPHVNQINKDGSLNHDMCILCHTKIPDRRTIDPAQFYLRVSMGKYCIGCHIGMMEGHPGGETHYGKNIPSVYRKRIINLINSSILYIPTQDNKLVCPSCHNAHQKGVILKDMAKRGADEKGRMRFFGYETCNACHKGVTTPTDSGSPF